MTTWIKNNLTALLSFFVVILTAVQGMNSFGAVNSLQLAVLFLSSLGTIIVPLVTGKWAGALKTGLDLGGALIIVIIPLAALWSTGTPFTWKDLIVIGIGFAKAAATELGVQIRTNWGATSPSALIAAGVSEADAKSAAPVITVLPATTVHQTTAGPVVISHPDLPVPPLANSNV